MCLAPDRIRGFGLLFVILILNVGLILRHAKIKKWRYIRRTGLFL
jgi:hypothetical protein